MTLQATGIFSDESLGLNVGHNCELQWLASGPKRESNMAIEIPKLNGGLFIAGKIIYTWGIFHCQGYQV